MVRSEGLLVAEERSEQLAVRRMARRRRRLLGCVLCLLASLTAAGVAAVILYHNAMANIAHGADIMPWIPLQPPLPTPTACHDKDLQVLLVTPRSVTLCWPDTRPPPYRLLRTALSPRNLPQETFSDMQESTFNDTQQLLPGCTYQYRLAGAAPEAEVVAVLPHTGNCGNANDVSAIVAHQATIGDMMQSSIMACVLQLFSRECLEAAIAERLHVSNACSGCWATLALCTLENCMAACAGGSGHSECEACAKAECLPQVLPCTGLPPWVMRLKAVHDLLEK